MSRKLVRHALADWFNAGQIPGLDMVHPGLNQEIPWANYGDQSESNCQAEVFIARRPEVRIAVGGSRGGQKEITSAVQLMVYFRSTDPDWQAAQDAMDDITESIVLQLRGGDHAAGRPPPKGLYSVGEFAAGIDQEDAEPVADDGGVMYGQCVISFEVKEIIFG